MVGEGKRLYNPPYRVGRVGGGRRKRFCSPRKNGVAAVLTYLSIYDTFFQPDALAIQNALGEIVTLPVDVLV